MISPNFCVRFSALSLEDIKLLQRSRAKTSGVASAPSYLTSGSASGSIGALSGSGHSSSSSSSSSAAGAGGDSARLNFKTESTTVGTGSASDAAAAAGLESAKEAFIREQLQLARATANAGANKALQSPTSPTAPTQNTNAVSHSAVDSSSSFSSGASTSTSASASASASVSAAPAAAAATAAATADAFEGGERWLSGIEEISLPLSEKLRNIDRTAAAHAQLQRDKEARLREVYLSQAAAFPTSGVGMANLSTNYKQLRREWGAGARAEEEAAEYAKQCEIARKKGLPLPPPPRSMAGPGAHAGAGAAGTSGAFDGERRKPQQPGVSSSSSALSGIYSAYDDLRNQDAWLGPLSNSSSSSSSSSGSGSGAQNGPGATATELEQRRLNFERAKEKAMMYDSRPSSDLKSFRDFKKMGR